MFNQFHLRITALIAFCLISFATLAFVSLQKFEFRFYIDQMLEMSPFLSQQLVPKSAVPIEEYDNIMPAIEENLNITISIFSQNNELIWGQKPDWNYTISNLDGQDWVMSPDKDYLLTQLDDGRWIVLRFPDAPLAENISSLMLPLVAITALLALIAVPLCFGMTGRLKRLTTAVQSVGYNDLNVKIPIEGKDEIASLATSFNGAIGRIKHVVDAQKLLLANASHELRTPLARVRLGLELMERSGANPDKYNLNADIQELDMLLEELLMLSRMSSDGSGIAFESVDLKALVETEARHYPDIQLKLADDAHIYGSARMMRRLLRNLLDNAYTHGVAPVLVTAKRKSDMITLSVSDSGAGIPQKETEHLLEPFARGEGKHSTPGHGLGLAIVNQVAKSHAATVAIEGSKITVRFDAVDARILKSNNALS